MEKIVLGEKFNGDFIFRETCFGICIKEGKLLLTKQLNKNEYSLVGGGIEKGESHSDCLKREFLEEAGFKVTSLTPLFVIDCFWLAGGTTEMESLVNIYEVEATKQCSPLDNNHITEWVDFESAHLLLPLPYHKEALKQYKLYKNF